MATARTKKTPATKTPATKTPAAKTPATKTPAAKTPATKTPATKTIAGYVAGLGDWRGDVVAQLCALVEEAAPEATGSIKWAQPVFEDHGPFCYVRAFASHVNLGFWRGVELPDPGGRLHSGGKRMAHVKITGPRDIDAAVLTAFVKAAVQLNRTHGDPTKRT